MTRKVAFFLNTLTVGLFIANQSSHALQVLDENDLRDIDGQEGVLIETRITSIDIEKLYWQDQVGSQSNRDKALRATANNVSMSGANLGADIALDVGSNGTTNGIDLSATIHLPLVEVSNFNICDTAPTPNCQGNIGSMGLQSSNAATPLKFHFTTQDGLFNADSDAKLEIGIQNMHLYLGQQSPTVTGQINQLLLKNLNFNFKGFGRIYVDDTTGLNLTTGTNGYIDLNRVEDGGTYTSSDLNSTTYKASSTKPTSSGLNLEFLLKKDVDKTNRYVLTNSAPENAKGLIRVGASGRIVNGFLQIRGTNATGAGVSNTILGNANQGVLSSSNPILGSTGIALRMKGDFVRSGDTTLNANASQGRGVGQATTLEIGGAGNNSYGFEFGELSVLRSDDTTTKAYFDSGNVYLNLTDTKTISLPSNYTFENSRFGGGTEKLTSSTDYLQNIHNGTGINPYAFVIAVRGMEFQALSKQGRFTNSIGVTSANKINDGLNQWGLALPIYNLNANLAIYGAQGILGNTAHYYTTSVDAAGNLIADKKAVGGATAIERLGFSMAMSTAGVDRNAANLPVGNKTTSILVIDGANNTRVNKPTDYYMGLRNIDMLLKGTGSIGVENGSLNVSLPQLLIVMAGELAAGYLPGAAYKTCPIGVTACTSPIDNFGQKTDVLMGLKLRLGGDMSFSLIPHNNIADGSRLSIVGDFSFDAASKNTLQISDPIDDSILGLDNITGKVRFNNSININRAAVDDDRGVVGFNMGLTINPDAIENGNVNLTRAQPGALRIKDVNLYPKDGAGQRLGELALTGGTLNSQFKIIPRN